MAVNLRKITRATFVFAEWVQVRPELGGTGWRIEEQGVKAIMVARGMQGAEGGQQRIAGVGVQEGLS